MAEETREARRTRLEKAELIKIEPFFRAQGLETMNLYWLGVSVWPPPLPDREWLLDFLHGFIAVAAAVDGTEPMQFLQMETVAGPIRDIFLKSSLDTMPVMGMCARPQAPPAKPPTDDEIKGAQESKTVQTGEQYGKDYSYWFMKGNDREQRDLFVGYGGLTVLLAKPDEKGRIKIPEVRQDLREHPAMREMFAAVDLQKEVRVLEMMRSEFRKQSLTLFGEPFKDTPHYRGIPFVLPQWTSRDFLNASEEQLKALFTITDIYVRESPEDKGLLIASKKNLDEALFEQVKILKERRMFYATMERER